MFFRASFSLIPDHVNAEMQHRTVLALVESARDLLAKARERTTESFLTQWPMHTLPSRRMTPRALSVLDWTAVLEQIAVPETLPCVRKFVISARSLAWSQTYSSEDFGAYFLERYAWTELMGLRGPIASTQLAAGFLFLGPAIEYPLHSHEAEEIYFPLAGAAEWKRNDGDWIIRPPGKPIYHASWMPHAMRTKREPLLALYVWRGGNLAQKSTIL